MAHGDRAERLAKAGMDACYVGRHKANKGWCHGIPRRTKRARGGPSHKVLTHREDRRAAERAMRKDLIG